MSQNEKRLFDRHKKQEEPPLEQTQAVPAVQDEITAEPAAEAPPKRNKYADKMNRKKRRLSKGARIGITAAAVALLLGGGIWAVVKSRDAGTEDVTQTTAMVSCGDLETYIEGSGVTAAKKREELGREVKGKVTQVLVAEGDEVHTGDPLLVIDPTETRKELADAQKGETIVTMKVKGYGEMQFKFFMKKAPLAVKNFVTLASNGYFDGQIFHRVINDFMIQSGDPTGTGTGGESIWGEDFDNEVCEELLPLRGSLCMANSGADTNGSQFFIVQAKADTAKKGLEEGNVELTKKQQALFLDQGGYPSLTGSYTVFGQMINGYDVLDKISGCKTQDNGSGEVSQPVKKVVIEKMTVSNAE